MVMFFKRDKEYLADKATKKIGMERGRVAYRKEIIKQERNKAILRAREEYKKKNRMGMVKRKLAISKGRRRASILDFV